MRAVTTRPSTPAHGAALLVCAGVVLLAACTGPNGSGPTSSPATAPGALPGGQASGTSQPPSVTSPAPTTSAAPAPEPSATTAPADEHPASASPPTADGAAPVLASATLVDGKVELTGFVQGLIVAGRECRFEVHAGSVVVSASSTSEADATSTLCPAVTVDAPGTDASRWTARLVWVPSGATSPDVPVSVG